MSALEAPPAPAPAAAPAQTEHAPADFMSSEMSDFAEMDAGRPPKPDDDKPAPKSVEKPAEKPAEKPEDKAPEKPAGKPAEKPADEPPKPVKAAELRTAYEGLKKRVKEELEPEVQKLRSKVTELESRKPEDAAPVLAKVQTLEKENAELKKSLALVDYTQEPEYQKVHQEYAGAWNTAVSTFTQLKVAEKVQDGVDDLGEPKFTVNRRPANENDLLTLANLPLDEMDERATEMFGHSAARAIAQLERIRELAGRKQQAETTAREKSVEWKSRQALESQTRQKQSKEHWDSINKTLEEKYPKAFRVEEGNEEDKTAHARGFALANLLFLDGSGLTPEQVEALPSGFRDTVKAGQPLSDVQKVQLHAIARLKIANHDRKVAALKTATARIAELEKELAEYENSTPRASRAGARDAGGDGPTDFESEIRALDKG